MSAPHALRAARAAFAAVQVAGLRRGIPETAQDAACGLPPGALTEGGVLTDGLHAARPDTGDHGRGRPAGQRAACRAGPHAWGRHVSPSDAAAPPARGAYQLIVDEVRPDVDPLVSSGTGFPDQM